MVRRLEAVPRRHQHAAERYYFEAETMVEDLVSSLWWEETRERAGPEDIVTPIDAAKLSKLQLHEQGRRPLLAINPYLASFYGKRALQKQVGLWFDRELGRQKGRGGRPSVYSKRVAVFYGERKATNRRTKSDDCIIIGAVRDSLYYRLRKKHRKGNPPKI